MTSTIGPNTRIVSVFPSSVPFPPSTGGAPLTGSTVVGAGGSYVPGIGFGLPATNVGGTVPTSSPSGTQKTPMAIGTYLLGAVVIVSLSQTSFAPLVTAVLVAAIIYNGNQLVLSKKTTGG